MPFKKNYPKDFYPHSQPSPPYTKPQEFIKKGEVVETVEGSNYSTVRLNNGTEWEVEIDSGDDFTSASVVLKRVNNEPIPNPLYKKQKETYDKEYEKYKNKLKGWQKLKKKRDLEEAAEKEIWERKQYEKLKKKYDRAV
jgi:hypothetical protein